MGFFSGIVDSVKTTATGGLDKVFDSVSGTLFGGDAADAALQAAALQSKAGKNAIAFQRESRDLARADLAPFVEFGQDQIGLLQQLLTPQGQADYLNSNPLFDMALDRMNKASLSGNAALGLLNSGNTLDELNINAILAGMPLLQNQQNQLFNAVNMGQASAAGQANTALNTGNSIADLFTQKGAANAGGVVGAQGAKQAAFNNLLGLGGKIGAAYAGRNVYAQP